MSSVCGAVVRFRPRRRRASPRAYALADGYHVTLAVWAWLQVGRCAAWAFDVIAGRRLLSAVACLQTWRIAAGLRPSLAPQIGVFDAFDREA